MAPFAALLEALRRVRDPRRAQGQRYTLPHLLLFSVLAVLAGATSYRRIRLFILAHRERLNATFGARFRRAPAVNTLRALLHALDPAEIEAALRRHAEHLGGGTAPPGRRAIALDGKTLRGNFDHLDDQAAAQVLSAFASEGAHPGPSGDRRRRRDRGSAGADRAAGPGRHPVHRRRSALPKNLRRRGGDRQRPAGARQGQPAALA